MTLNKLFKFWILFTSITLTSCVNAQKAPAATSASNKNITLECRAIPALVDQYLNFHITHKKLTPTLKARSIDQIIKILDPSKTLLLKSDVKEIKAKLNQFINSIVPSKGIMGKVTQFLKRKDGTCDTLYKIKATLLVRAKENEAFVRSMITNNYVFDKTVEILLDPDDRSYAGSIEEKNKLISKMVHFQMANYIVTDVPMSEAKNNMIHRYELFTKSITEKNHKDFDNIFLNGLSSSLDPHSSYFSSDALKDFQIQMSLSLEGIGASLSWEDGFTKVEEIIPGGAADRAGQLMEKDKIIGVAQGGGKFKNVIDMELSDVVKHIRGKKGTKVRLNVLRKENGQNSRLVIEIIRDKIKLEDQAANLYVHERTINGKKIKLGVIDLPSFYGQKGQRFGSTDIIKLIADAKKQNVQGFVLNLAHNGGGLLDEAIKIAGLFIKTGNIVATKEFDNNINFRADGDPNIYYNGPLVILTSRRSASASEILAGALKDYGRALIVGADHTYGKGSVQTLRPMSAQLGAIKVTTGFFYVPGGYSTQKQGVSSHFTIPSIWNNDEIGEYKLDYSLPAQKIGKFLSKNPNEENPKNKWKPIIQSQVNTLKSKSEQRVKTSEDFKEVLKDIKEAKEEENNNITKLSKYFEKSQENETKRKKDKGKTRKQRVLEMQKPQLEESLNILADLIELQSK